MKTRIVILALFVAAFAVGCSGSSTNNESSPEPVATEPATTVTLEQARKAGEIARATALEPNRTEEILAQHGISAASLQNLLVEIGKDSLLTAAYEEAKRGPQ